MFGNGRLLQFQLRYNLAHRTLLQRQVVQDVAPPRLRHGVESIRSGSSSCHGNNNTFPYKNMSTEIPPSSLYGVAAHSFPGNCRSYNLRFSLGMSSRSTPAKP